MSHVIELPDETYQRIVAYAAREGKTLEEAISTWAEAATKGSDGALSGSPQRANERINNPTFDPWAGFRGVTDLLSADGLDQHDAYLAEEYTRRHEPGE